MKTHMNSTRQRLVRLPRRTLAGTLIALSLVGGGLTACSDTHDDTNTTQTQQAQNNGDLNGEGTKDLKAKDGTLWEARGSKIYFYKPWVTHKMGDLPSDYPYSNNPEYMKKWDEDINPNLWNTNYIPPGMLDLPLDDVVLPKKIDDGIKNKTLSDVEISDITIKPAGREAMDKAGIADAHVSPLTAISGDTFEYVDRKGKTQQVRLLGVEGKNTAYGDSQKDADASKEYLQSLLDEKGYLYIRKDPNPNVPDTNEKGQKLRYITDPAKGPNQITIISEGHGRFYLPQDQKDMAFARDFYTLERSSANNGEFF